MVFFFWVFCFCISGISLWVMKGMVMKRVVRMMLGIVKMIWMLWLFSYLLK